MTHFPRPLHRLGSTAALAATVLAASACSSMVTTTATTSTTPPAVTSTVAPTATTAPKTVPATVPTTVGTVATTVVPTTVVAAPLCPPADPAISGAVVASTSGWDLDGDGTDETVELIDDASTRGGWIRANLSGGGAVEGELGFLDTLAGPALDIALDDLDPDSGPAQPEAIFIVGFGAAGHDHTVRYIDGCSWTAPADDPAHGSPALVTHAAAATSAFWSCGYGPDGEAKITTSERQFTGDDAAPIASWSDDTWRFDDGAWTYLSGMDSTTSPTLSAPPIGEACPFA